MNLTFTQLIPHDSVVEGILQVLLIALIVVVIVWISVSIYYAFKSNKRFEPMREADKDEWYFLVKSALYKAIKAYENNEPLGEPPDTKAKVEPTEPQPKKTKVKVKKEKDNDHGFKKRNPGKKR